MALPYAHQVKQGKLGGQTLASPSPLMGEASP